MKLHPDQKLARAAARIIEKQGKTSFHYGCDGGPRCIVGAISQHMKLDPSNWLVRETAGRIAVRLGLTDDPLYAWRAITRFSDHHLKRTVVKKLMECP